MEVIVLRAEVQEPETIVGGGRECAPNEREHSRGPQAADGLTRAERDVHRVRGDVQLPWAVLNAGPTARGKLAPAPARRPPQVRGAGKQSCCKARAILIRQ